MDNVTVLARVLGPLLGITALGLLINYKAYLNMVAEFAQHRGLSFLAGYLALTGGLLILAFHRLWLWDWVVLITILGWVMVIKGAVILIFPSALWRLAEVWSRRKGLITAQALADRLTMAGLEVEGVEAVDASGQKSRVVEFKMNEKNPVFSTAAGDHAYRVEFEPMSLFQRLFN